ncbi:unnamed protein product [Echinostoma caproni]|uniref:Hva1_TUDOR domain-containing protein n=1 Tax=Echinostoma caproni TaxID=27848 RepID=A0A183AUD5_9TREM|nr:unnamed protein product [Echinostoma caproni]
MVVNLYYWANNSDTPGDTDDITESEPATDQNKATVPDVDDEDNDHKVETIKETTQNNDIGGHEVNKGAADAFESKDLKTEPANKEENNQEGVDDDHMNTKIGDDENNKKYAVTVDPVENEVAFEGTTAIPENGDWTAGSGHSNERNRYTHEQYVEKTTIGTERVTDTITEEGGTNYQGEKRTESADATNPSHTSDPTTDSWHSTEQSTDNHEDRGGQGTVEPQGSGNTTKNSDEDVQTVAPIEAKGRKDAFTKNQTFKSRI